MATMRLIRSNEAHKRARNLTNCKYFDLLSFINYDHLSTLNFKRKKSINPSIFRLGKYASIDHFVTDETDLKVTGQSLFCLFVA